MKIYHFPGAEIPAAPTALSIGMFDGVHRGHRHIIEELVDAAQRKHLVPSVLTFWPHPRKFFSSECELMLLNTMEEKVALLESSGIKQLIVRKFDQEFAGMTGEEFVREVLVKQLQVKFLMVGYDHTFGKGRSGNIELLEKLAPELGFEVVQMSCVQANGVDVSSTKIRNELRAGKIANANKMLGYHYQISGKVLHGKKIGRTLGYPTANIEIDADKILPKKGAYIVEVFLNGLKYKGMLSIMTNPSVGSDALTCEVHILDFSGDIYGEKITVSFHEFLHDEIKFNSIDELKLKLDEDKKLTQQYHFNTSVSE